MTTAAVAGQTSTPAKRDETLAANMRVPPYVVARVDMARGLFAALVVVAHALDVARTVDGTSAVAGSGWSGLLIGAANMGFYWVMGFFAISGYCIQLSLGRLFESDPRPFRVYSAARLTRILPLYYLGLLFALCVEIAVRTHRPEYWTGGIDVQTFVAQLFLVQGWRATPFGSYSASWSITHEVFYYALYGVLVLICASQLRTKAAWIGLLGSAIIVPIMLVIYFTTTKPAAVLRVATTFAWAINWFIGVMVALYAHRLVAFPLFRHTARLWPVLILLTLYLECGQRWIDANERNLILAAVFGLMLIDFYRPPARAWSALGLRLAGMLGLTSYPVYLFHGPILILTGTAMALTGHPSNWRIAWPLLLAMGLIGGAVMTLCAEAPLLRWRSGVLQRLRGKPAAAPATH